jgi:hypothetical protein
MKSHYPSRILQSVLFAALAMVCATAQTTPADKPATMPRAAGDIDSATMKPKALEDLNTPSLVGSELKPADPVVGGIDTIDNTYIHEVTRVEWRPGDPIDLYIVKPVGVKNPPVILYLYSFPFETDRFLNHDFCKFLVKNGFAAVGFASALTGQRYHDIAMKQWFVSEMKASLASTAHDVQMILNYLAARGDMDMNRVGMFGDGSGASIAILAAAVDPRIKTLDLLDPWGDWPDWAKESKRIPEKERPDYLTPTWQEAVAPVDPVKWLPQLKTENIRIQFIRDVAVTPADVQQKIEAAAPPQAKVVRYDNTAAFRASIAGGTGFDWIKQNLPFRVVPGYAAADAPGKGPSDRSTEKEQNKDSQQ